MDDSIPNTSHAMCLVITDAANNHAGVSVQDLARVLAPYSSRGEGPVVYNLTYVYAPACYHAYKFWNRETAQQQVLEWCERQSIPLLEDNKALHAYKKSGLVAVLQHGGISGIYAVRQRTPLVHSWRVGGTWSGLLRRDDTPPTGGPFDLHNVPPMPCFGDEWEAFSKEAMRRAANTDMMLAPWLQWPIPHTSGPALKLLPAGPNTLSKELSEPIMLRPGVLPWAIVLPDGELLHHGQNTTNREDLFQASSWEEIVERAFGLARRCHAVITTVDLVITTPSQP